MCALTDLYIMKFLTAGSMIAGGPGTWQRRLFRPSCLEEKPAETRKRPVLTAEMVTNTTAFILQRDK